MEWNKKNKTDGFDKLFWVEFCEFSKLHANFLISSEIVNLLIIKSKNNEFTNYMSLYAHNFCILHPLNSCIELFLSLSFVLSTVKQN